MADERTWHLLKRRGGGRGGTRRARTGGNVFTSVRSLARSLALLSLPFLSVSHSSDWQPFPLACTVRLLPPRHRRFTSEGNARRRPSPRWPCRMRFPRLFCASICRANRPLSHSSDLSSYYGIIRRRSTLKSSCQPWRHSRRVVFDRHEFLCTDKRENLEEYLTFWCTFRLQHGLLAILGADWSSGLCTRHSTRHPRHSAHDPLVGLSGARAQQFVRLRSFIRLLSLYIAVEYICYSR